MVAVNLKNITINERQNVKGETYFVIKDNEQNQVYFCFQNKLKDSWQELVNNYESLKEVEIEFEEHEKGNKVISLYMDGESEIIV